MKNYILTIIICLSLLSCSDTKQSETETTSNETAVALTDAQVKNAGITVATIEKQAIAHLLKVNGVIDVPPQNMVSISAPLGGYLKYTKLLPGMHINKGESIAVMEDPQYISLQQEYLTAKAKLSYVQNEYIRQESLNKSAAVSDKVFQEATMNYTSQKVLVKSLSEKLLLIGISQDNLNENTISRSIAIHSPIDGYVSKVNVNIGKYASPTDVLFELVNPQDIHLALDIFEMDIDNLQIGQKLLAYTNTQPDKKYPCEIILIGKDISETRSVEVHCHFDAYDKSLIPGMYMNAEIEVSTQNDFVIAEESIVTYEGRHFVFYEKSKNNFEIVEVEIGNSENGITQITFKNNFNPEQKQFVIKGAYSILMKSKNTEE